MFAQALKAFDSSFSIVGSERRESVSFYLSRLEDSSETLNEETSQVQLPEDSNSIFEMTFQYVHQETQQLLNIPIILKATDDPVFLANRLRDEFQFNLLTFRWLHLILQHASRRLSQDVIQTHDVNVDGRELSPIELRCGDDLAMLSSSYAHRHSLPSEVTELLLLSLIKKFPQHSDEEWINCRSLLRKIDTAHRHQRDFFSEESRSKFTDSRSCHLTVAIFTNSREAFLRTINNFPSTVDVCDVIVIPQGIPDDSDIITMVKDFPHFNFIVKADESGGEAYILNSVLRLAKSRYLLYLNDSWQPISTAGHVFKNALSVLKTSPQPLAQVLLNDQSSHQCQYGMENGKCSISNTAWKRVVSINEEEEVEYIIHEFATLYPEHATTSSWPGMTLSWPAIWDLNTISSKVPLMIDEATDDFELIFSLKAMDAGLKTAYIPDAISFRHMG